MSQLIQWTDDGLTRCIYTVQIDLSGFNALMTEEFLHNTNADAVVQKVRSKRVAEYMGCDVFTDASQFNHFFNTVVDRTIVDMVAAANTATRIFGGILRRENVLPFPLLCIVLVLSEAQPNGARNRAR